MGREDLTMSTVTNSERKWSASELRNMTPADRDRIFAEAAAEAESLYQSSYPRQFEAFGEDDLQGLSSGPAES